MDGTCIVHRKSNGKNYITICYLSVCNGSCYANYIDEAGWDNHKIYAPADAYGSGGSISPKEMRYAGVFLLKDGTEITLSADYSLSDIPKHEKGVLKHRKGRMVYFSVTSESCL